MELERRGRVRLFVFIGKLETGMTSTDTTNKPFKSDKPASVRSIQSGQIQWGCGRRG